MKKVLNYLGQLRIYSLLDVLVFALAITRDPRSVLGICLLWLSFILLLETLHRDELRYSFSRFWWLTLYIPTLFLLPPWLPLAFLGLSILYSFKKKLPFSFLSPLLRGGQNALIAFAFASPLFVCAFVLTTARNLIGDFRDIGTDRQRNIQTIPALLGFKKNLSWAFYGHLIAIVITTLFWAHYGPIGTTLLVLIIGIEIVTYPLTPRLSTPKALQIYS